MHTRARRRRSVHLWPHQQRVGSPRGPKRSQRRRILPALSLKPLQSTGASSPAQTGSRSGDSCRVMRRTTELRRTGSWRPSAIFSPALGPLLRRNGLIPVLASPRWNRSSEQLPVAITILGEGKLKAVASGSVRMFPAATGRLGRLVRSLRWLSLMIPLILLPEVSPDVPDRADGDRPGPPGGSFGLTEPSASV